MLEKLQGKKTYIIGVLMIVYAGLGVALHLHSADQAGQVILTALGIMGLRHGITTSQDGQQ